MASAAARRMDHEAPRGARLRVVGGSGESSRSRSGSRAAAAKAVPKRAAGAGPKRAPKAAPKGAARSAKPKASTSRARSSSPTGRGAHPPAPRGVLGGRSHRQSHPGGPAVAMRGQPPDRHLPLRLQAVRGGPPRGGRVRHGPGHSLRAGGGNARREPEDEEGAARRAAGLRRPGDLQGGARRALPDRVDRRHDHADGQARHRALHRHAPRDSRARSPSAGANAPKKTSSLFPGGVEGLAAAAAQITAREAQVLLASGSGLGGPR